MEQTNPHQQATRRAPVRRLAAALLAVGALSAPVFAVSTAGAATRHAANGAVISTLKSNKYGTILVSGNTVYTLKPSNVRCTAKCHRIWPEVLLPKGVTKPTAGAGVRASKLGTVRVAGGALQVTYSGRALYWFFQDKARGQVNGLVKDTWGTWSDVVLKKPAGGNPGGGGIGF